MFQTLLLALQLFMLFRSIDGFLTVKCDQPEAYNLSQWTCEDYELHIANNFGENLPKTLGCLGYNKFKDPNFEVGITDPTLVDVSMVLHKVKQFDIESSVKAFR